LHALGHVFEANSEEAPTSPNNGPGHHHDSLPQLMASGLVEQRFEFPLLQYTLFLLPFRALPAEVLLLVPDWDAQTAPGRKSGVVPVYYLFAL